jgi:secreted trypsin-like serine protease
VGIISFFSIDLALLGTGEEQCQLAGFPGGFTQLATYSEWIDSSVRKYSKSNKSKRNKKSHKGGKKGSSKGMTRNRQF